MKNKVKKKLKLLMQILLMDERDSGQLCSSSFVMMTYFTPEYIEFVPLKKLLNNEIPWGRNI